jgi:hypothetical protein
MWGAGGSVMEHIEVELKILGRLRADSFEQGLKMMLPSIICAAGNLPAHVIVEVISLARSAREIVAQVYVSVYKIAFRPCNTARSRRHDTGVFRMEFQNPDFGIPFGKLQCHVCGSELYSGFQNSIWKTPVSCLREGAVLN